MISIKKTIRVFTAQFRQQFFSIKTCMIFLIMAVYIYNSLEPVNKMIHAVGINATPTGFVHIMNDYICQTILTIGIIFLFSSAPFRRDSFRYIVYRSGQRNWEWGNILYILSLSFIYVVFLCVVSLAAMAGKLDFEMDSWGKIWGTLARTNAPTQFGVKIVISDYLLGKYEPVSAMLSTFLLTWGCYFFLGLLIYFCNLHIKGGSGIILSGILVFLDVMIYNSWTPGAYRFSPLTLVKLTTYTNYHKHFGLSLTYAAVFFLSGITVMCLIIVLMAGKRERDYDK